MAWGTAGKLNNPTSGAILADTGPLASGALTFVPTIMIWADGALNCTLHYRNAANTGDNKTQQMSVGTFGSNFQAFSLTTAVTVQLNERLTLTLDNNFTGNVQASIITG